MTDGRCDYCGAHNSVALLTLIGAIWVAAGTYAIWWLWRNRD